MMRAGALEMERIERPFILNLFVFSLLLFSASSFSVDVFLFSILTIIGILVFLFEPFKLVLVYTVLIFYRDVFIGQIFGIEAGLVDYLTITSNFAFVLLLLSLLLFHVKLDFRTPLLWPILFFSSVMAVSCIFSSAPGQSLQQLFRLLQLVGYFFVLYTLLNSGRRVYYFIMLLLGIFAMVILVSGYNLLITHERLSHLSRFMIFPAVALGLFLYLREIGLRRIAFWLMMIAIAGSFALLITESRRVLMSIAFTWFFFLVRSRSFFGSLVLILALTSIAIYYSPDESLVRFERTATALEAFREGAELDEEQSFALYTGRDKLWEYGFGEFKRNPVFGIGLGRSKFIAEAYAGRPLRLHNIYLEMLVETGVIGFLAFLILLYAFVRLCFRILLLFKGHNRFYYHIAMMSINLIIIFYITNYFGGSSVFEKYEWIFYGILAAAYRLGIQQRKVGTIAQGKLAEPAL